MNAPPHRKAWTKPSPSFRALLAERLRTMGEIRTADSLKTSVYTITALRDGGTANAATLARLEATAREQAFKACGCGRFFTRAGWLSLELVGVQRDEQDPNEDVEMRNCPCGSTLGVLVVAAREVAA